MPSFGLPSGRKDLDKLEQIKEKTINEARGKDAPGVAVLVRQEHNGHFSTTQQGITGNKSHSLLRSALQKGER